MFIRAINPDSEDEINLVAQRMRDTLIEVEGEQAGTALYSIEWLRQRVRFHLDPAQALAKVYLALQDDQAGALPLPQPVIGHTIVRQEFDAAGQPFGLFSTTYVLPLARRSGVAHQLLLQGETWMREQGLPAAATWTSQTNLKLIRLYARHGYVQVEQGEHQETGTMMVKLAKSF